jgi:prepilin-type N-terminal cleavage/methylation domain-containing protein
MKQSFFRRAGGTHGRGRSCAIANRARLPRRNGSFRDYAGSGLESAFTLVEMLAVMAIIVVVLGFAGPAVNSIRGANDFSVNMGTITGFLEQARAYAVANNTYVYVGIGEFDASKSTSTSPQVAGNGRLVTCAVATLDGTSGYDVNNPGTWAQNYSTAPAGTRPIVANLTAIDKLHVYDNIQLVDFSPNPATGQAVPAPPQGTNMYRPTVSTDYFLGHVDSSYPILTPLAWPLGKALKQGQYNFSQVVQFDPQGVARLQFASTGESVVPLIEIDLQPTHGNIAPTPPTNQNVGNQAAIQIDCVTGGVHFYRP